MFTLYVVCCQLYYFHVSLIYSEYLANAVERDARNGRGSEFNLSRGQVRCIRLRKIIIRK